MVEASVAPLSRVSRDRSVRSNKESRLVSLGLDLIARILLHGSLPIYGEEITRDVRAWPIRESKYSAHGDRKNSIIFLSALNSLSNVNYRLHVSKTLADAFKCCAPLLFFISALSSFPFVPAIPAVRRI